jgi:hypothetical protein
MNFGVNFNGRIFALVESFSLGVFLRLVNFPVGQIFGLRLKALTGMGLDTRIFGTPLSQL